MSMADPLREEDALLAAELAFGLLEGEELHAAEQRLGTDPAFAAACRRWQDHAASLVDGIDEAPSPSLWARIAARLPANDTGVADARLSVRRWQIGTLMASMAAALLGVIAVERGQGPIAPPTHQLPAASPPLVAMLSGAEKSVVAVSFDLDSGRLVAAPTGLSIAGHDAELWVIPAGGKPVSLGVIAVARPHMLRPGADRTRELVTGATLAISVEPIGGSPTGQPTGPVILTGKLMRS
jgi:anti-sigma-K factor RskA